MLARVLSNFAALLPSELKYKLVRLRPVYLGLLSRFQPISTVKTSAGAFSWKIDALTSQQILRGCYEPYMQAAFTRYVRPGGAVYDVGAHAGFHSLFCALLAGPAGRVIAFEPNPGNFRSLTAQLELNPSLQVTLLPYAILDRNGDVRFEAGGDSSQGHISEAGSFTVAGRCLDSLVEQGSVPPPSVIKIDVEGAEEQVIAGALQVLKMHRPVVLCDRNDDTTETKVRRLLAPLDYNVVGDWPIVAVAPATRK
ncbi:MAG: FkbM family methyltransferase [Acidobacteriia bacterium]|nr:FkbM family methyltransferase [Terriglobia bacterium]